MLVSIGMVPFIRAQCGGIAEFVAQKLDQKVRDNLRDSRNSLFQQDAGALTFNRPLLLLLDRNFDLATPLAHSWTYQVFFSQDFLINIIRHLFTMFLKLDSTPLR
jgi:hypothetical protein